LPYLKDEVISHFYSNDDIIECVIASALIPFALNGRPWHRFRDWYVRTHARSCPVTCKS
jgi:hypothetical protein